ncbi:MAG: hypothetical protein V4733_10065 [Verrucomicrobiota bacterium]
MDDIPLEAKIAQAEADDASLNEQIAQAAAINSDLGHRLQYYRKIQETQSRKVACLMGLAEQNAEMERELARIEGREYRDPDDPDGDWPEPPDDPPEP